MVALALKNVLLVVALVASAHPMGVEDAHKTIFLGCSRAVFKVKTLQEHKVDES